MNASTEHPCNGSPVTGPCTECKREPNEGEVYGSHAEGWDFLDICPECWDEMFGEEDEKIERSEDDEPAF